MRTDVAAGQFDTWTTGEADYDIMDVRSTEFVRHEWGMRLTDATFEAAFEEFRDSLLKVR